MQFANVKFWLARSFRQAISQNCWGERTVRLLAFGNGERGCLKRVTVDLVYTDYRVMGLILEKSLTVIVLIEDLRDRRHWNEHRFNLFSWPHFKATPLRLDPAHALVVPLSGPLKPNFAATEDDEDLFECRYPVDKV